MKHVPIFYSVRDCFPNLNNPVKYQQMLKLRGAGATSLAICYNKYNVLQENNLKRNVSGEEDKQ